MSTVNPTSSASLPVADSTTSTVLPKNTAEQQKTQFLKLLVAQLQGQNPLDPKDGTEFVTQLAQFSSLEELINIRTTLDSFAAKTPSTSTASTTDAAPTTTAAPNPFQGA